MSGLVGSLHGRCVHPRRVRRLVELTSRLIPAGSHVLDVGCGDGLLDQLLLAARPDLTLEAIDVLLRPHVGVPAQQFDGRTIPLPDASVDVVLFSDVLHHASDPMALLREARRVSRGAIVIKDHLQNGWLAGPTLRFMDRVGNARHGVALGEEYWPRDRWRRAFEELELPVDSWEEDLRLYPGPADWVFGRSLHFLARLRTAAPCAIEQGHAGSHELGA